MKRVLITGGTGFLGRRLSASLGETYLVQAASSRTLDLTDRDAVMAGVESFGPDYVVHCAAQAETDYCNRNPDRCHEVNVVGSARVAEACARGKARLIFMSTEQVFNGNLQPGPYDEEDSPEPDTEYGRNKLEAESIISTYCPDGVILRLTWLFGLPGRFLPPGRDILWGTVSRILKGEYFSVPVSEYRGMTNVDELADRFSDILKLPGGLYHTGSENPLNRYETVCHILETMGMGQRREELVSPDREIYSGAVRDIRLDTSRLRGEGIGFAPTPEALTLCLKEYGII